MTVSIRRDAPSAGSDAGRGRDPAPPARSGRLLQRIRKGGLPYLFLLPALLLELLIHFIPMIFGIVISFKQLTLFFIRNWTGAPWAGWGNYRVAVNIHGAIGSALLHSFVVTCSFTVLAVGLSWLFGTVAAILTQDTFRGRAVLRTIFLTPFALPVYASVIVWAFMFQYNNGLVNQLLHNTLGITSKPSFWLIGHNSFFALVIISIWRNWPFAFLCVMAGLQGIPPDLYEASAIDGAGIWQQIRKITMPSLRPVNQVLVLVLFLWTFNDFTTPFVLFGSSAPNPADVISIHIYQASFITWNFGEGSAMSVLMLLFLLVVTAAYLLVTSRRRNQGPAMAKRRGLMAPPPSFLWTRRIVLSLLTLFALVPVYVMISSSVKPLQDVTSTFRWIPSPITFSPYHDIWYTVPLARYFLNSLVVSAAAAALSVAVAVFAAYAVSRYGFRGKRIFTTAVLSTQMFPGILFALPLFLIFVSIGNATGIPLFGSRGGLIITYLTFSLPFAIWMLTGYFESVPKALDEAALVDGCGAVRALFRVVIPAALPGIVAVTIYAFMTAWGEVLFASVMTNNTTRTLAVGLADYSTQNNVYWNQIMAASLVVSVPVVAGFLIMQRYLVAGLTSGAVK